MQIRCTLDPWTDKVLALLIAALWAAITLLSYFDSWAPDLAAIYFAGHFYGLEAFDQVYASPENFFGSDTAPAWQAAAEAMGKGDEAFFPFVYPPIWAALAAPLALAVDPITFFNIFLVAHVVMLASAALLTYRVAKPSFPLAWWAVPSFVLLYASLPSVHALMLNQPQITVAFLAILAMERLASDRSLQAGAALGLAAAIKLTPIVLVLVFLIRKDWRAVFAFGAVSGSLAIASFVIAGPELHWIFLERVATISDQVAVMKVNYAVENLLYQIGTLLSGAQIGDSYPIVQFATKEPLWVSALTRTGFGVVIVAIIALTLRLDRDTQLRVAPVAVMLAATLFGPIAWAHHYLFAMLMLPTLFVLYPLRPTIIALMAFLGSTTTWAFSLLETFSAAIHIHMIVGVLTMTAVLVAFLAAPTWQKRAKAGTPPRNLSVAEAA